MYICLTLYWFYFSNFLPAKQYLISSLEKPLFRWHLDNYSRVVFYACKPAYTYIRGIPECKNGCHCIYGSMCFDRCIHMFLCL
uniref:Uncharacterized protein n=1 Tax=Octopus bimaculoides TaxID=37653 RepID=A0A0L8FNT5_OCTBM